MRQWIRIAVVVLILLSGVATPALAQPEVGGGEGNESGPDIPEEEDVASDDSDSEGGTESEGNGSGISGGDGVLGGGGLMPSADDWLESASEWIQEDFQNGVEGYVDRLNAAFVGVAAPGEPFAPSTWIMPDGMWSVPAAFYVAAASMSSVLWAAGFVYLFDIKSRQKQREVLRTLLYAIAGTVFGMLLLGLYFNAINTISTAIAPSGTEFVADGAAGYAQLGLGHIVVLILLAINAGVVILGGFIMFGVYSLPLVLYAFWPFIVASKAVPVKPLQSTANLGLTTLALLPLLRLIQSLLLRLADMMVWNAEGLGEQVAGLLGTGLILAVALLVLPYIFYKNIETASGMALSTITVKKANQGAAKVNDAATWAGSRAKSRAKSAAAPHVNRARSAAGQKASNATFRAGSRIGGAMLTAKFGRPGHTTPAQAAKENRSARSRSGDSISSSSPSGSTSKMPEQPVSSRTASRQRAINRLRRDAIKRRQRSTQSDD